MPRCPLPVQKNKRDILVDQLAEDVKGHIRLARPGTAKYCHVLDQFAIGQAQRPFFLVIENGAQVESSFGLLFRRQRQQYLIVEILQCLLGRREDLFFDQAFQFRIGHLTRLYPLIDPDRHQGSELGGDGFDVHG